MRPLFEDAEWNGVLLAAYAEACRRRMLRRVKVRALEELRTWRRFYATPIMMGAWG